MDDVSLRVSFPSELSLSLRAVRRVKWCILGRPPTVRWFIPSISVRRDDNAANCGTLPLLGQSRKRCENTKRNEIRNETKYETKSKRNEIRNETK